MVYILETYEYDPYSYAGIAPSAVYVHATRQGAEDHAKALGLAIMEYINNPEEECCITAEELYA